MKPGREKRGSRPCPCSSGRAYGECCAPLHKGEREAPDPPSLVRARFAAFALGEWGFVSKTEVDRGDADAVAETRAATRGVRFMRVDVLDHRGDRVLFLARMFEKGKDLSTVELSDFVEVGGAWRYVTGQVEPASRFADARGLTIDRFEQEVSR